METFSALLAFCAGNSPVTGEFPSQRPVTRRFDVFFDLRQNKRLDKQSWCWWFETPSRQLWRHRNELTQSTFESHEHISPSLKQVSFPQAGGHPICRHNPLQTRNITVCKQLLSITLLSIQDGENHSRWECSNVFLQLPCTLRYVMGVQLTVNSIYELLASCAQRIGQS